MVLLELRLRVVAAALHESSAKSTYTVEGCSTELDDIQKDCDEGPARHALDWRPRDDIQWSR
jgi:hypothetical protein